MKQVYIGDVVKLSYIHSLNIAHVINRKDNYDNHWIIGTSKNKTLGVWHTNRSYLNKRII
jgi:hypothetical protein